jgi:transaldolase
MHEGDKQPVPTLRDLRVKIFSDGADLDSIQDAHDNGIVRGFTTNPTLMAKAGVVNYLNFAREVLRIVPELPVSFEVFSDDFDGMQSQARVLHELGDNVYVKIPVTNTRGESACPLIRTLSPCGVKLNITAMMPLHQVHDVVDALAPETPAIVSVFAGRIADSGRDPIPYMSAALEILKARPKAELLWASPREALNIVQADRIGCHIITVTPDLLAKAQLFGKQLDSFSLETVQMFFDDARRSGYTL